MRSPWTHRRGVLRENLTKRTGQRRHRRILVHSTAPLRPTPQGVLPDTTSELVVVDLGEADQQPVLGVGEVAGQLVHVLVDVLVRIPGP